DLSYPQIAALLGIEEAAARKRVSCALQRLEAQMRKRRTGGSAAGFFAAAVAQQSTVPVSASLASSAMAAASAGAAVTTTAAAPFSIVFSAFMSHTALKIAVCAATAIIAPLVWQTRAN